MSKEITVTYTLEVTEVFTGNDDLVDNVVRSRNAKVFEKTLKEAMLFDDVKVQNCKVFIRENV